MSDKYMVVGIDGSSGSQKALEWAAARTDRFGQILPVAVWQIPLWAAAPPNVTRPADFFHAEAAQMADEMLAKVESEDILEPLTIEGQHGPELVNVSKGNALLVVGTRGRGSIKSRLLGSVSLHCANHSEVPLAVIPLEAAAEDKYKRIVVGVDGSELSEKAVEWALKYSSESITVEIVNAWSIDYVASAEVAAITIEHLEQSSRELVNGIIDKFELDAKRKGVKLVGRSEFGDARNVLLESADKSDLLVLGARGHRGVSYLLLGSVATALIHQPKVATVIVR